MTVKKEVDIYQAMNDVMKEVGYVKKSGRMSGYGASYTFAGEGDLIAALRPACVEHGIVIHPLEMQQIHQDSYITSNDKNMNRTEVVLTYRFAHAPSGSFCDVTVAGEGADTGDKSSNKAMTGAFKYALRQAFMIETGDDPDVTPSDDGEQSKQDAPGKAPMTTPNFMKWMINDIERYDKNLQIVAVAEMFEFDGVPTDKPGRMKYHFHISEYAARRNAGMEKVSAVESVIAAWEKADRKAEEA